MQATVATYDEPTRSGTVLFDDGVVVTFGADSLAGSHIRHLRPGQRVIVELDGSLGTPAIAAMRIH